MSVTQTVQSFAGIANENEFYGYHYLAEVFKGDIRTLIESWQATEEAAGQACVPAALTGRSLLDQRFARERLFQRLRWLQ